MKKGWVRSQGYLNKENKGLVYVVTNAEGLIVEKFLKGLSFG